MTKGAIRLTGEGFKELSEALGDYTQREARNLIRATIGGIASDLAKEIKAGAPVDTGGLRKSVKVKREKSHPDKPVARIEGDFEWRFNEYGTMNQPEKPFVRPATEKYKANEKQIMETQFAKKLEKFIARRAKRAGKK